LGQLILYFFILFSHGSNQQNQQQIVPALSQLFPLPIYCPVLSPLPAFIPHLLIRRPTNASPVVSELSQRPR
jgi:hypothetical protein